MLSIGAVLLLILLVVAGAIFAVWVDMQEKNHDRHIEKHRCQGKDCKKHVDEFEKPW